MTFALLRSASSPPSNPARCLALDLLPWIFLLLAAILWLGGWNQPLFIWLHTHQLQWGTFLWANLTMLGDSALTPLVLVVYIRKRPDLLWAAFLGGVLTWMLTHGLKPWIDEARPPAVLSIEVIGRRLLHSSFPSGHSASIFALVALLVYGLPVSRPSRRWALVGLACLVGLSRIGVVVHWPVDVLAGAAMGWLCARAGLWLSHYWVWGKRGRGRLLPLGLLLVLALYDLFWNKTGFDNVWPTQYGLTLLALARAAYEFWCLRLER